MEINEIMMRGVDKYLGGMVLKGVELGRPQMGECNA